MRTEIRTVWLLGFIALVAPAAGCFGPHHDAGYSGGSQACLDTQFFEVQWAVDHGENTLPLSCTDLRSEALGVVLLTDALAPYDRLPVSYYPRCDDRWSCTGSGGAPCNADGTTASGVPVGTSIVEADLVAPNGAVLSSANIDPANASLYEIRPCTYTIAPFIFAVAP